MKKLQKILAVAMLTAVVGLFTSCDILGGLLGNDKITITVVDDAARHIGRSGFVVEVTECNNAWIDTGKTCYIVKPGPEYYTLDYETGKITIDASSYFEEGKIYKVNFLLIDNSEIVTFVDGPGNILKKQYESDKEYSIFIPKKGKDYVITLVNVRPKSETGYSVDYYDVVLSQK